MEHEARDVMARLAERTGPPIGFTADEIAARGHRQARNQRIGAMVGGAASLVGVVAVTAAVLPGSGGTGHGSGPLAPATTRLADPACVDDVDKVIPPSDGLNAAERAVAIQACPLLKRMNVVLDPAGTHLGAVDSALDPAPTDVMNGIETVGSNGRYSGATAHLSWTPDGHHPSSAAHPMDLIGPFVDVNITVQPAGAPDEYAHGTMDHLSHPELKPGQAPPDVPWSAPTSTGLSDGSTVTVRSEHDSGGSSYLVTRTMRSGVRLELEVTGVFNDDEVPTSFPFTEDQLVAAVSVPGVDDFTFPSAPTEQLPSTSAQAAATQQPSTPAPPRH